MEAERRWCGNKTPGQGMLLGECECLPSYGVMLRLPLVTPFEIIREGWKLHVRTLPRSPRVRTT